MTRDEIIKMAREAGGMDGWGVGRRISDPELRADNFVFDLEDLGRFAALVAAAEREACYQIALTIGDDDAGCRHTDEVARRIRARSNT